MIQLLLLLACPGASAGLPLERPSHQEPDRRLTAGQLRDAFAGWRLDVLTREDGPAALASLRALVEVAEARLAEAPDDPLVRLVAQMWTAELDELDRRRDPVELESRTLEILGLALLEAPQGPAQGLARAARLALDPGRVQRALQRTGSAPQGGGAQSGPSEELIAAAVQDAVRAGDADFVTQVGEAAIPTLRALSRAAQPAPAAGAPAALDPLALLARLDPGAALDVALEHAASGDILRKTRVVRAFEERSPFASGRVWNVSGDGKESLMQPEWAGVVTGLLQDPGVPAHFVDGHLGHLIRRDFGTAALGPAVEGWLQRNWPNIRPMPEVVNAAARRLVNAPDPRVAERAAEILLLGPDATSLYARMATDDAKLRRALAPAFGPREVAVRSGSGKTVRETIVPEIDTAYRQALDRFVRGRADDPTWRALAATAEAMPAGQPQHVDGPMWSEWLAAMPAAGDARLEPMLALLAPMPEAERVKLSAEAAGWIATAPEHPRAGHRVGLVLKHASANGGSPELRKAAQACIDAGLGALAIPAVTERVPALIEADPGEAAPWIDWCEGQPSCSWRELVESRRETTGYVAYEEFLQAIPAREQLRIIRALWAEQYDKFGWLDRSEFRLERANWMELVADPGQSTEARLWALEELCNTPGEPLPQEAARVFAQLIAQAGESKQSYSSFRGVGVDPQQVLIHLLDQPGVADTTLLDYYVPLESPELADRVHARFPASTWKTSGSAPLLSALVWHLVQRADPASIPDLVVAAQSRGSVRRAAVEAVVATRNPIHLPVAGALLRAGDFSDDRLRLRTVNYVAGLASNEAMGHLLAAARETGSEEYREELFTAAQRVLAWRELEDRWRMGTEVDREGGR